MKWMSPRDQRSGSSAGARVSSGRFSPTSPKGGFGSSIYDASKAIGRYYGYDPESYYKQRLFGNTPADVRWRYELNKHLIGRDYHKKRNVSFTWQPRFPKKKYVEPYDSYLQKSSKFRGSKLRSWTKGRGTCSCKRWKRTWADKCNRQFCSNRMPPKVYRNSNAYY